MIDVDRLLHNYLSEKLGAVLRTIDKEDFERAEEIRIRLGKPLYIRQGKREVYPLWQGQQYIPNKEDIEGTINKMSNYSVYAFNEEMKRGFLTLPGGCRVGICGEGVRSNEEMMALKNISSLNIRLAREVKGCGDKVIDYIYNKKFYSTLVVSPPACGKTTLLRDIIRQLSNRGLSVGVADERGEIAGTYMGQAGTDVGTRTDVMDGCIKSDAMYMLLRSMSPDVIAADEIGSNKELHLMREIANSGIGLLCSVHGSCLEELTKRPVFKTAIKDRLFDRYVVLSRRNGAGTIEGVYDEGLNKIC